MTSANDDELALLTREIADKATYVQNQTILIDVLERDGHDVSDYQKELAKERSHLATRIAKQFMLLELTTARDGHKSALSAQG